MSGNTNDLSLCATLVGGAVQFALEKACVHILGVPLPCPSLCYFAAYGATFYSLVQAKEKKKNETEIKVCFQTQDNPDFKEWTDLDIQQCPVCYESNNIEFRALPTCHHSFCTNCIKKLAVKHGLLYEMIKCPLCRQKQII